MTHSNVIAFNLLWPGSEHRNKLVGVMIANDNQASVGNVVFFESVPMVIINQKASAYNADSNAIPCQHFDSFAAVSQHVESVVWL